MRVPEDFLKCVGYVGEIAKVNPLTNEIYGDLHGTGFFVCMSPESPRLRKTSISSVCFVTAKHLVEKLIEKQLPVYFKVNKVGGGTTHIKTIYGNAWYLHPTDKTADVAVIPVGYQSDLDIKAIPVEYFGTPEVLQQLCIGIGDEVYATGLFQPPGGAENDVPIVRHGNIAMMPREQIQTEYGYADVYLVEARSIGGLSGSPVFVRPTVNMPVPDNSTGLNNVFVYGHGATLLGLMHGHWSIDESELNSPKINQDRVKGVNLGIAIVVPAQKILETINRPELIEMRKRGEEAILSKGIPEMDSAKQADKEMPFSKQDFETALTKVTQKVPRA